MDTAQYIREFPAASTGKEMAFPESEYRSRVNKVKELMAQDGLEALLVTYPPDLFYLTGYYTFGSANYACLVLPLNGDPTFHIISLEIPAVVVNSWVRDLVTCDWHEQSELGQQLVGVVKDKGLEAGRIGVELDRGGLLPNLYNHLQDGLPGASFQDASEIVAQVRLVKSSRELEYLRRAATYTRAGINASLNAIKAGVTDNNVAKAGYEAMIDAGSEFFSVQPIVTSGPRSSYSHGTFRRVQLKEGDAVFLEYGGCHQRYTSPMMRTAVIGRPTVEMERLADAAKNTVASVIETAGPGLTCHEVAREAHKAHASVDDEMLFLGAYGYSVGLSFPPTWSEGLIYIAEGVDRPLLPGMPFHLPIVFSVPGKFSIAFSETILITEQGCEILTEKERDLHLV